MNEQTQDAAFAAMDATPAVPQTDGTVTYKIVEGDTFLDGKLVEAAPEVIGYVQSEAVH